MPLEKQFGLGDDKFMTERLRYKPDVWSLRYMNREDLTVLLGCKMGNVGSSVLGP